MFIKCEDVVERLLFIKTLEALGVQVDVDYLMSNRLPLEYEVVKKVDTMPRIALGRVSPIRVSEFWESEKELYFLKKEDKYFTEQLIKDLESYFDDFHENHFFDDYMELLYMWITYRMSEYTCIYFEEVYSSIKVLKYLITAFNKKTPINQVANRLNYSKENGKKYIHFDNEVCVDEINLVKFVEYFKEVSIISKNSYSYFSMNESYRNSENNLEYILECYLNGISAEDCAIEIGYFCG